MVLRLLLAGCLIMTWLTAPARAEEFGLEPEGYFDGLPAGIVNVATPNFGEDIIIGGDYGLGNVTSVEETFQGPKRVVNIFRSPALPISHKRPAQMQVLLGNVRSLYVWLETPPVQGEWSLSIDQVYADGTRKNVFGKHVKPGVRDFFFVDPHTRLDCHISTKTTALKLNRKFILTISPVMYAVWPDFLPMPHRTIFD
jgi:hypothetical protein